MKSETFINLRNDQWFFTVPKKIEGTLSLYNNTEKIDPSYRTELLLYDFGTITLNEVARQVTKETTVQHTFNQNKNKNHKPKSNKLLRNKPVIHNPKYSEESKSSI